MSNKKKELNKVECLTTVLNPNQRKQQKYSDQERRPLTNLCPFSLAFPLQSMPVLGDLIVIIV
jgi:hypothetical protein